MNHEFVPRGFGRGIFSAVVPFPQVTLTCVELAYSWPTNDGISASHQLTSETSEASMKGTSSSGP